MFIAVRVFFCVIGINIRILEQPQPELGRQHTRHSAINFTLGNHTLLHLINQRSIDGSIRQVVIHTRRKRQPCGICFGARHVVGVYQHLQSVAVGSDKATKAPLLPQHLIEQPVICVGRNTINLIVRSHHAAHMPVFDSCFKWNQKIFRMIRSEKFPGAVLVPPSGCPCTAKCFMVAIT